MGRSTKLARVALSLLACGCASEPVPEPQDTILALAGRVMGDDVVRCEGPAEELDLLGALCGYETIFVPFSLVGRATMTTTLGLGSTSRLLIYGTGVTPFDGIANRADELRYAVFVSLASSPTGRWTDAEPVDAGMVVTEVATAEACTTGWVASGAFLWRSTRITASWSAVSGC